MKKSTVNLTLATALLVPLATACSDSTKAAPPSNTSNTSNTTLGDKANDMTTQASTWFADLKRSTETRLAGLDTTIADLRAKAASRTEDAREDLEDLVAQIEAKKVELQKTLNDYDLKKASKSSYDNLKTRVDAMVVEINKVVEKAKAQ